MDGRHVRIDFKVDYKVIGETAEGVAVEVVMVPDPERYEWVEEDGKRFLFDKLDRIMFPESVLADAAKQLADKPIYYEPSEVKDALAYAESRREPIRAALASGKLYGDFVDKSEEFLNGLEADHLNFAILSVDLCGSTKLSQALSPEKYALLIQVLSRELGEIVPKFRGHVLKYTGDGIIAYFTEPSIILKTDLAVDCALSIRHLIDKALNPALVEAGLPAIQVRSGIDVGKAAIVTMGNPATKQHKDLIGAVVSLACKVQGKAPPGSVALGMVAAMNTHVQYRKRFVPADVGADWPYKLDEAPYKVYKLDGT